jgi:hypothetical protein
MRTRSLQGLDENEWKWKKGTQEGKWSDLETSSASGTKLHCLQLHPKPVLIQKQLVPHMQIHSAYTVSYYPEAHDGSVCNPCNEVYE